MMTHNIPMALQCKVSTKLFELGRTRHVISADYTTDMSMPPLTHRHVTRLKVSRLFARLRFPPQINADNDVDFVLAQFR